MPLYDFKCNECNNNFEDLVRNDEIPACPACHSRNVVKKVSCCARYKSSGQPTFGDSPSFSSVGGGCGGCSGGNCGSCGR